MSDTTKRLEELRNRLRDRAAARRTRRTWTLVLGGVLATVSGIMLYRLSMQGRELTPGTIVQIARTRAEPQLPGIRKRMEEQLNAEAPQVVRNGMQGVIDSLPNLRAHVTKSFGKRFDSVNTTLEKKVGALMEEAILKSKADLDRRYPKATDREKLEMLGEASAKQLNKTIVKALDAMYPEYASEVTRLRKDIDRLYASKPSQLTREEQIKRELLRTMVQLARREMDDKVHAAVAPEEKR